MQDELIFFGFDDNNVTFMEERRTRYHIGGWNPLNCADGSSTSIQNWVWYKSKIQQALEFFFSMCLHVLLGIQQEIVYYYSLLLQNLHILLSQDQEKKLILHLIKINKYIYACDR